MSPIVALDLGGVVVDVDHGVVLRRLGIDRPALDRAFFDGGLHDDVTVGRIDGEAFARTAAIRLGLPVDAVRDAWSALVDVLPAGRALVEDLLAAGVRVHLWSNTDPLHLARMLGQLPAGVEARTASFHLGAMKPAADFYTRAAARGAPALFLDDLAKNVDAALANGVRAERVDGPHEARGRIVAAGLL